MSSRAGRPPQPSEPTAGDTPTPNRNSVTLGPRDRLIGRLYIEGDLHVNGTVEGEVEATGDIEVAEAANVKATVAGRDVSVSGQVDGPVTASRKLVISRSATLNGDVRVPRLVVQDGATFSGNVSMGPVDGAPRKAATPAAAKPAPEQAVAPESAVPESPAPPPDRQKQKRR